MTKTTAIGILRFAILVLALVLGFGCSRDDRQQAGEAASKAADQAAEKAEEATAAVAAKADQAAAAARQMADDAAADASAAAERSADAPAVSAASDAKNCLDLAKDTRWADALEPCTRASNSEPENLALKHAMQQAQAGAAQ